MNQLPAEEMQAREVAPDVRCSTAGSGSPPPSGHTVAFSVSLLLSVEEGGGVRREEAECRNTGHR